MQSSVLSCRKGECYEYICGIHGDFDCGAADCGTVSPVAHWNFWRGQRECVLYGLRGEMLPGLPLHDGAGHGEQGHIHLSAIPG